MSDARADVPRLTQHRSSGQAVVRFSGRDFYCGAWTGKKPSKEAVEKYDRLLGRWLAAGRQIPGPPKQITIAELMVAYNENRSQLYRFPNGKPRPEMERLKRELDALTAYGFDSMRAVKFHGLELIALRNKLISAQLSRSTINHHIGTIRRMYK